MCIWRTRTHGQKRMRPFVADSRDRRWQAKAEAANEVTDPTKFKAAKTKAASKKGKGNQWQTLESMGIPRDIIPRLVDRPPRTHIVE